MSRSFACFRRHYASHTTGFYQLNGINNPSFLALILGSSMLLSSCMVTSGSCDATYKFYPTYRTTSMKDVRLDINNGGKTLAMATDQYARTYMWAPFMFATPFANASTATDKTVERFIAFFSSEIKQRGLHL